ncbi:lasso peptide biosynthesis B2 protein [Flavobacterium sp. RSP29]|uniref:lasso peptide biosynthesis B2 protein n=1 Tax=Flavobacterium sp. RSP29 TaxID=3401731 RepID=UPI003AAF83BD
MISLKKVTFLYKFVHIPKDEKKLFFEAVLFLFFSKTLLFLPFRYCIKRLRPSNQMIGIANPLELKKIHLAVYRANRLAFWKNICLVQSFAARLMLQRRNIGSVLYLGLQFRNDTELVAHAWLVSNEIQITLKGRTQYKEIFSI